MPTTHY